MFVTSAREVAALRCRDFIDSPFEYFSNDGEFALGQTVIFRKLQAWFQPEFRFSVAGSGVNMHSRLFSREKEKPIWALAKDRWTHCPMLHRRLCRSTGRSVRLTDAKRLRRGGGYYGCLSVT